MNDPNYVHSLTSNLELPVGRHLWLNPSWWNAVSLHCLLPSSRFQHARIVLSSTFLTFDYWGRCNIRSIYLSFLSDPSHQNYHIFVNAISNRNKMIQGTGPPPLRKKLLFSWKIWQILGLKGFHKWPKLMQNVIKTITPSQIHIIQTFFCLPPSVFIMVRTDKLMRKAIYQSRNPFTHINGNLVWPSEVPLLMSSKWLKLRYFRSFGDMKNGTSCARNQIFIDTVHVLSEW